MAISCPSPFNCNAFAAAAGSKGPSKTTKNDTGRRFQANCLAIMDEVQVKSQPVIITKHGKVRPDGSHHRSDRDCRRPALVTSDAQIQQCKAEKTTW
jgi:hypothetical protein